MKKIIPFTKEIEFKTMLSSITSISLEHTLRVMDYNAIAGDFIVSGTYKMTQASQLDEEFSYKVPIDISIDDKYDTIDISIDIEEFNYEIIDEKELKLNISLCIDNLEEKKLENVEIKEDSIFNDFEEFNNTREEGIVDLFLDTTESEKLELPEKTNDTSSLFANFNDTSETFSTYSIYIVKEEDSIETIMNKYNITKDELEEYNTLSELKKGTKIIIPNIKNEQ